MSIATCLREAGHNVELIDGEQLQLSPQEVAAAILDLKPSVVGLNAFSANFSVLCNILRKLSSDYTVVLGGPHVSSASIDLLNAQQIPRADFIVRGDGEVLTQKIVENELNHDEEGLLMRSNGRWVGNTRKASVGSLERLPVIDRGVNSNEPYEKDGLKWCDVSISRGCLFTCGFCAGSCRSNGTEYRKLTSGRIAKEIHAALEIGANAIRIVDDLPFVGGPGLNEFLDLLESFSRRIFWEFNFPVAYLKVTKEEQFARMRDLGVSLLSFGIESGDEVVRRKMGKVVTDAELFNLSGMLIKYGIRAKGYFIVGFPGELREQTHRTIELAKRLNDVGSPFFESRVFSFKPTPGSAIWNELVLAGWSELELMEYSDFQLDVGRFQKHAWTTRQRYSEYTGMELAELINDFYNSTRQWSVK